MFLEQKGLFECVKDYHQWEEKEEEEDKEEEKDSEEKDADSSVFEKWGWLILNHAIQTFPFKQK